MADTKTPKDRNWSTRLDINLLIALVAIAISGLSFYRSYIYTKQQLEMTVTEVSYVTNQGELYMTVAFSNGGNRDAALLRAEPAIWSKRGGTTAEWVPLSDKVRPDIPVTDPKPPLIIKAGGVEVLTLSTKLDASEAQQARLAAQNGAAFVGIRVETMNSDGNLYLLQHPVARLVIDKNGRIKRAEAAIHQSLSGFDDVQGAPPGDQLQSNKKTPFVWADEQS